MRYIGRRPTQKRGSRCLVLLLPLYLLFVFFVALTIVRFPSFAPSGRVTAVCLTAACGVAAALVSLLLYKRTKRFYRLGADGAFPCVGIRKTISRSGQDFSLVFFCADEKLVRTYLVADDADALCLETPDLSEAQHNKIADRFFELQKRLNKTYSYEEFIPFDLNFLHKKVILCEKTLFSALFGNGNGNAAAPNDSRFELYDAAEWKEIRENWLKDEN